MASENGERIILAFNQALNARDVDNMMRLMTADCVFENTYPPPDGACYQGQAAVRAFWQDFFRSASQVHIENEDLFGQGDQYAMRWVYHWVDAQGQPGHIRGVDIYTLADGLIHAKRSYVKG